MLRITAQRKTLNANRWKLEVRNEKVENEVGSGNNPASHLSSLDFAQDDPEYIEGSFHTSKHGFTLIEFLVVLGLLVLTVGSTLLFLTSILKGSNKANVTAEAKQNGQAVLESLEKKIRNANSASPIGINMLQVTLDQANITQKLYLKCIQPTVSIPNGWIGIYESDTAPGSDASFSSITNQDPVAGVDIEGCSFDVLGSSDGGTSPPLVTIRFTVNQGISAPSRRDFVANVQLQTTISLRQYRQ